MREQLREEVTPRRGTANRHKGKGDKTLILIFLFNLPFFIFIFFSLPQVALFFIASSHTPVPGKGDVVRASHNMACTGEEHIISIRKDFSHLSYDYIK